MLLLLLSGGGGGGGGGLIHPSPPCLHPAPKPLIILARKAIIPSNYSDSVKLIICNTTDVSIYSLVWKIHALLLLMKVVRSSNILQTFD